ncbi:MAG: hypothetical protein L6R19_08470 [Alphaproteobacteria bacterium]|nr:hypothetical protein [Alphaproteobacteria bacterium]
MDAGGGQDVLDALLRQRGRAGIGNGLPASLCRREELAVDAIAAAVPLERVGPRHVRAEQRADAGADGRLVAVLDDQLAARREDPAPLSVRSFGAGRRRNNAA